jgi:glycosyltransferase involved in cell wall biosynthesis
MRILFTQDTDWIKRNPVQQHHLAERLDHRGHEIIVIDHEILWRSEGKKELISKKQIFKNVSKIIDNTHITVVRPRVIKINYIDYISMVFFYYNEIKKQIVEFQPDIIIGHSILTNYLSMRLAKKYNIPFVFHMTDAQHRIIPSKILQPIGKYIESIILKNSTLIIVINDLLKDYAIEMGANPRKVKIIKSGIDLKAYNSMIKGDEIREKYRIEKKDLVLFFMGWLYNFSGLKEVAMELFKFQTKNIKLLIVGDGEGFEDIKKFIDKHQLHDSIILTGKQPFALIPKYIAAADICLLPAYNNDIMRDIVPIKMYEYMAMGKPVIATKLPGVMREFGNDNGVIFIDYPEDTVEKANELSNANTLEEYGLKSRHFVESNDWNKITEIFEKSLKDVFIH